VAALENAGLGFIVSNETRKWPRMVTRWQFRRY